MTEQERIQQGFCRRCEASGVSLIHGLCRACFNGADAFEWASTYYRQEERANQLSFVGAHLLAALTAIHEWCGSDDGAHALPDAPPWAEQMRATLLLVERSPVRLPKLCEAEIRYALSDLAAREEGNPE